MTQNGSIEKFKRTVVAPKFMSQKGGVLREIKQFVPVVADWVKETTSEATMTVSLSAVIPSGASAVALVQRIQDDASNSFVEVSAKASVSTNSAAKMRTMNSDTSALGPVIAHGIIPINSDLEVLWQVSDSKGSSVQTASLGIVGYWI